MSKVKDKIRSFLLEERHIAPLAVFRMAFGALMFYSTLRFIGKGWVHDFYVYPTFHFTLYGFEWVKSLGEIGMYSLFFAMALASLCILLGLFYRIASFAFFISFLYVELIDKTYYLNHYYFVSLISFLLLFVPAHCCFSLDVIRKPSLKITHVPAWTILLFQVQLCIVYFFAGISKLHPDWLFQAMPLKIWLPANRHLPLIGPLIGKEWAAYLFSWVGAIYDLSICYFLWNKRTRMSAYIAVVIFHLLTAWLFKIGMFPYIMICAVLIFFSEDFHKKILARIQGAFQHKKPTVLEEPSFSMDLDSFRTPTIYSFLLVYFTLQLLLPLRFLFYPGHLLWHEQGYRFSWRVMLMEKGGTSFFYVNDPKTGIICEVNSSKYLSPQQEKMMSTQPDMILQYAHFLDQEYRKKGIEDPTVTVESYVSLNGSGSRPFVDTRIDLSKEKESFLNKTWVLPFQ